MAITVNSDQKNIAIQIEDDGPGFPTEVLDTFGKKRVSRKLDSQQKGRISLGLGGVVMNKICESYLGTLNVYNKIDSDEHTKGAGLKITFPQKSIS